MTICISLLLVAIAFLAGVASAADLAGLARHLPGERPRPGWIRADTCDQLTADLSERFAGRAFAAHEDMLREFLGSAATKAGPK